MKYYLLTMTIFFYPLLWANDKLAEICKDVGYKVSTADKLKVLKKQYIFPNFADSIESFPQQLSAKLTTLEARKQRLLAIYLWQDPENKTKKSQRLNENLGISQVKESQRLVEIALKLGKRIKKIATTDLNNHVQSSKVTLKCLELEDTERIQCDSNSVTPDGPTTILKNWCNTVVKDKIVTLQQRLKNMRQLLALSLLESQGDYDDEISNIDIEDKLKNMTLTPLLPENNIFGTRTSSNVALDPLTEEELSDLAKSLKDNNKKRKLYKPAQRYIEAISHDPLLLAFQGSQITNDELKVALKEQLTNYDELSKSNIPIEANYLLNDHLVAALKEINPDLRGDYCIIAKEIRQNFVDQENVNKYISLAIAGAVFVIPVPFAKTKLLTRLPKTLKALAFIARTVVWSTSVSAIEDYRKAAQVADRYKNNLSLCKATFFLADESWNSLCDFEINRNYWEIKNSSRLYNKIHKEQG